MSTRPGTSRYTDDEWHTLIAWARARPSTVPRDGWMILWPFLAVLLFGWILWLGV